MKKVLLTTFVIVSLCCGWAGIRFFAMTQGWGIAPIASKGDSGAIAQQLTERIEDRFRGNVAMAIMEKGQISATLFASKGSTVNADTLFSVASVSKWVTAVGVMRLVEQGKLSLDQPVSQYLTRWKLPSSEFDNEQVTLRRLLSHTAGMEDGLGHNGFSPEVPVQPLTEHLTKALDADPNVSGRVAVTIEPGTEWVYSGGSYNLVQLIIEEVSGQSFQAFMHTNVFQPLGMDNTRYIIDRDDVNLAQYFGENSEQRVYPNYTSLAATGLYTTIIDMAKFIVANIDPNARPQGSPVLLSNESLKDMRQPVASVGGMDIWGSGLMLFAPKNNTYVMGHGGKSPFLNATARFDPQNGNGFIMFQTGNDDALASDMATLWTLWLTGKPDMYMVSNLMNEVWRDIIIGIAIIVSMTSLVSKLLFVERQATLK